MIECHQGVFGLLTISVASRQKTWLSRVNEFGTIDKRFVRASPDCRPNREYVPHAGLYFYNIKSMNALT